MDSTPTLTQVSIDSKDSLRVVEQLLKMKDAQCIPELYKVASDYFNTSYDPRSRWLTGILKSLSLKNMYKMLNTYHCEMIKYYNSNINSSGTYAYYAYLCCLVIKESESKSN